MHVCMYVCMYVCTMYVCMYVGHCMCCVSVCMVGVWYTIGSDVRQSNALAAVDPFLFSAAAAHGVLPIGGACQPTLFGVSIRLGTSFVSSYNIS